MVGLKQCLGALTPNLASLAGAGGGQPLLLPRFKNGFRTTHQNDGHRGGREIPAERCLMFEDVRAGI